MILDTKFKKAYCEFIAFFVVRTIKQRFLNIKLLDHINRK